MFKNLLKRSSANTPSQKPSITRKETVPADGPSLEVFQSHWRQALGVIKKTGAENGAR